jgi:hypothetical protein
MNDDSLFEWLVDVADDPVAFVLGAFPWGEGELKGKSIEAWQLRLLEEVRDGLPLGQAIREATGSGHGVGKSACVSWLILWAMTTFPDTKGVVTANTENQLRTKTWSELGKWYNLFIGKHHFRLTPTALLPENRDLERTWRIDMIPWSERNTEAFQGLHNQGKRLILIFDEASAIPNIIWEVAEGALTDADTQIIWAVFGNITRGQGRFRECFDASQTFWSVRCVDSREVSFTNKAQIAKWIEHYGIDSDFVKIRVLGQPPKQGEMEFFNAQDIDEAMRREVEPGGAIALGVDVARFGANFSVLYPRRGRDARFIQRRRYQGLSTIDLALKISEANREWRCDGIMIDEGGVGGGVVDQVRHLQLHCFGIQFGGKPSQTTEWNTLGESYANKRAEMYGSLRSWIRSGALPNDAELRGQLLSITYTFNPKDQIILTSKEVMMREGKPSPDDVDALALTFALPIEAKPARWGGWEPPQKPVGEYHPFDAIGSDYHPFEDAA